MVRASLNLSARVDKCSIFYCEYCTMHTVQCTLYNTHNNKWNSYQPAHWDSMKRTLYKVYSVRFSHCTLYSVQCTVYSDCTILNNKRNSYWPAHWDSMNRIPLRNPIYYFEYYRGIMFQFPPDVILYLY